MTSKEKKQIDRQLAMYEITLSDKLEIKNLITRRMIDTSWVNADRLVAQVCNLIDTNNRKMAETQLNCLKSLGVN